LACHPAARAVLNSVMLYHAVQYGLDMAIVNPAHITPYAEISEEERELAEDLIFLTAARCAAAADRAL
jgi:5-methyltetrahydrofolate--homocysteine methyltransferase